MSFSDTIFLFFLALILFGPKKLPEMAKQAGRLLAELRRASNEFRSQIENEIAELEVKKNEEKNNQPSAPAAAVASLSANPAVSESIPRKAEPLATMAAPAAEAPPASPPAPASQKADPGIEAGSPASQASHV